MINTNEKGFTLVELLAVIVILAIILAIAIPSISSIIENTKIQAYITNEKMVVKAAKNYLAANSVSLPITIGTTTEIKLSDLQTANYVSIIKSPNDKTKECTGYVLITKISDNSFDYTPYLNCEITINSASEDKLVGYWKLDNGTAIDYSLGNHAGTVFGTTQAADISNNSAGAMDFDGVDDYIDLTNSYWSSIFNNAVGNNFTIIAWIKPMTFIRNAIVSQRYGDAMSFGMADNGKLFLKMDDMTPLSSTDSLLANEWQQIAVTFVNDTTASAANIYINGKANGSGIAWDGSGGIGPQSSLAIGWQHRTDSGLTTYFQGAIDDVKIYNRLLSETEINQLYKIKKYD